MKVRILLVLVIDALRKRRYVLGEARSSVKALSPPLALSLPVGVGCGILGVLRCLQPHPPIVGPFPQWRFQYG